MTATLNRSWETSDIEVRVRPVSECNEHDRALTCYSRGSGDGPVDKNVFGRNW